ncbi:MAG: hypothetical protein ACQRW7_02960 [Caulobacterales bacterium]|uniref:hypothetical protein n=1 Tax=Glycocaulis sp. TaxID=1969725 RepID=UPI003F9FF5C2
MPHRLLSLPGSDMLLALIAMAGGLGAVLAQPIIGELSGVICGALLLAYIRASMDLRQRVFYCLASGLAALPFMGLASRAIIHFWPAAGDAAHMAGGFAAVMVCLPFVMLIRAGTRWIEDHPQQVFAWLWSLVPERWRARQNGVPVIVPPLADADQPAAPPPSPGSGGQGDER